MRNFSTAGPRSGSTPSTAFVNDIVNGEGNPTMTLVEDPRSFITSNSRIEGTSITMPTTSRRKRYGSILHSSVGRGLIGTANHSALSDSFSVSEIFPSDGSTIPAVTGEIKSFSDKQILANNNNNNNNNNGMLLPLAHLVPNSMSSASEPVSICVAGKEVKAYSIERFLQRVAEERLYGTFMQSSSGNKANMHAHSPYSSQRQQIVSQSQSQSRDSEFNKSKFVQFGENESFLRSPLHSTNGTFVSNEPARVTQSQHQHSMLHRQSIKQSSQLVPLPTVASNLLKANTSTSNNNNNQRFENNSYLNATPVKRRQSRKLSSAKEDQSQISLDSAKNPYLSSNNNNQSFSVDDSMKKEPRLRQASVGGGAMNGNTSSGVGSYIQDTPNSKFSGSSALKRASFYGNEYKFEMHQQQQQQQQQQQLQQQLQSGSPPNLKQRSSRYLSPSMVQSSPLNSNSNASSDLQNFSATSSSLNNSNNSRAGGVSRIFSLAPGSVNVFQSPSRKSSIGFESPKVNVRNSPSLDSNRHGRIFDPISATQQLRKPVAKINLFSKSESRREQVMKDISFSENSTYRSTQVASNNNSNNNYRQYVTPFGSSNSNMNAGMIPNTNELISVKEEEEIMLGNEVTEYQNDTITLTSPQMIRKKLSTQKTQWRQNASEKKSNHNRSSSHNNNSPTPFRWNELKLTEQFRIHDQSRRSWVEIEGIESARYDPAIHHMKLGLKEAGTQQIFKKLSGVQDSQSIGSIRTTKAAIKAYLLRRYDESMIDKLLSFIEVPAKVDFILYTRILEKLLNLNHKEKTLLLFMLYDENEDGYVCNTDLFAQLKRNRNAMIETDIREFIRFAQTRLNALVDLRNDDNDTEKILVKKNNLTLTEYKLLKKKGMDAIAPTSVKKDTLYTNSFQIIEHSINYRQSVQQLEDARCSQMMDTKKNKVKECVYERDHSFSINFDQFEYYMHVQNHFPYLYFDIVAYLGSLRFEYIEYPDGYDRSYYAGFTSFAEEQLRFQSLFTQLLGHKKSNDKNKKNKSVRAKQISTLNQAQEIILLSKKPPPANLVDGPDGSSSLFKVDKYTSNNDSIYLE